MTIEGTEASSLETGSLVFSVDGQTVLAREGDHMVNGKPDFVALYANLN